MTDLPTLPQLDDDWELPDDGTPQPASAPMTKDEADRLVTRTHGQLQAFRAADGNWYVYETKLPGQLS